ncbi:MAG: SPFH domain-containing protein [Desulfobacterales bacterium]|nr:SPFH domain-containing protein [Desulfobacterales bacterium]
MSEGKKFDNLIILEKLKKIPKMPKLNFRFHGRVGSVITGLIILIALYNFFFIYIKPNEFGIKIVRIGINRGVQEKVYLTGLHFLIPFGVQEMHRLPKDMQVLELTNFPDLSEEYARVERAAHIQTSDGFFVNVDISIIYNISDPYKVFTTIGPGTLFQDNGIIPKAEPVLKATLGELTTEEFYNSLLRVERAEAAKEMLNKELSQKGISISHVLVRYFKYSEEIQKNIEEKKLKDQLVFKNQAEARAATEGAKLKKIEQEGKALYEIELEKGKAYITTKRAEKDLYVRKKTAEGNLLVKLADAEKVRLKNEALKGVGAERMVGLKMADVYKGLSVIVLPSDGPSGVNPLDVNNAMKLFDVRK